MDAFDAIFLKAERDSNSDQAGTISVVADSKLFSVILDSHLADKARNDYDTSIRAWAQDYFVFVEQRVSLPVRPFWFAPTTGAKKLDGIQRSRSRRCRPFEPRPSRCEQTFRIVAWSARRFDEPDAQYYARIHFAIHRSSFQSSAFRVVWYVSIQIIYARSIIECG
jgi:hypothetical protein